jgi:hypothetical protein
MTPAKEAGKYDEADKRERKGGREDREREIVFSLKITIVNRPICKCSDSLKNYVFKYFSSL